MFRTTTNTPAAPVIKASLPVSEYLAEPDVWWGSEGLDASRGLGPAPYEFETELAGEKTRGGGCSEEQLRLGRS